MGGPHRPHWRCASAYLDPTLFAFVEAYREHHRLNRAEALRRILHDARAEWQKEQVPSVEAASA